MVYDRSGSGLGRRQRRMLADMARHGNGHYPQQWRMSPEDCRVMASLYRHDLVDSPDRHAALTEKGRRVQAVNVGGPCA